MKIMVFFVIFIYLIHSYGSLIEEFYLKFSIYMLATFLSSKRQAEVVDEKWNKKSFVLEIFQDLRN